jgi:hypothetical protein
MNTMGYKMNNKLTNVMGNKFSNRMHTMGNKMYPMLTSSEKYSTPNIMMVKEMPFDKKIIDNVPSMDYRMGDKMRKKMKSRLTK